MSVFEKRKRPKKHNIGDTITTEQLRKLGHLQNTHYQRGNWTIKELKEPKTIQTHRLSSSGQLKPSKKIDIQVAILHNKKLDTTTRIIWCL